MAKMAPSEITKATKALTRAGATTAAKGCGSGVCGNGCEDGVNGDDDGCEDGVNGDDDDGCDDTFTVCDGDSTDEDIEEDEVVVDIDVSVENNINDSEFHSF